MKSLLGTTCLVAACLYGGTSTAAVFTFDFESDAQGWTTGAEDPTSTGDPTGSLNSWVRSGSLPGTTGVSLGGTWWTNPNVGHLGAERSFVLSPLFTAGGSSVGISFDSFTSNESGYPDEYDVEHIQLSINGGAFFDVHGELADTLHQGTDQTFRSFEFITGGLTAGDGFQYRFLYDTGDDCCGPSDIEGWAFDNVAVDTAAVPEPGTLALFGIGLAGLAATRRRRKIH